MKRSSSYAFLAVVLLLAACGGPVPPTPGTTFSNATPIAIPAGGGTSGPADPYPSAIVVADLPTAMSAVRVRLSGLSHTWPSDLDVLLVGPSGDHVLLMSDAGGPATVTNRTLIFDAAATATIPQGGPVVAGTFLPSAYGDGDVFPAPAPAGPYATDLGVFDGTDPNGTWLLFVYDDLAGDTGSFAGGWSLTFAAD